MQIQNIINSRQRIVKHFYFNKDNKYQNEINYIIKKTKFYKNSQHLDEYSNFKIRYHIYQNKLTEEDIRCKNPNCTNQTHYIKSRNEFAYTCCKQCKNELQSYVLNKKTLQEKKEIKEKINNTFIEKYGMKWANQREEAREFYKQQGLENSPFKSKEVQEKSKKTLIERYNVDNVAKVKEFQEKRRLSWLGKKDSIINKMKKTNLQKYKSTSPFGSKEVQEKSKKTLIERYNVDNVAKVKEFQEKRRLSWLGKKDSIINKMRETNLDRYGETCVLNNKDIRENINKIMMERYGATHPMKIEQFRENLRQKNKGNWNNLSELINRDLYYNKEFIEESFINDSLNFDAYSFCEFFNVGITAAYSKMKELDIHYVKLSGDSLKEKLIVGILEELNIEVLRNKRDIISPFELDMYIPDSRIGIEYNGKYWHSLEKEDSLKQKYQHHKKTMMCLDKNIRLIHIYEDYEEEGLEELLNILQDPFYVVFDEDDNINMNYGLPIDSTIGNCNWTQPKLIKYETFNVYDSGYLSSTL